jgi:hypothetical protein
MLFQENQIVLIVVAAIRRRDRRGHVSRLHGVSVSLQLSI